MNDQTAFSSSGPASGPLHDTEVYANVEDDTDKDSRQDSLRSRNHSKSVTFGENAYMSGVSTKSDTAIISSQVALHNTRHIRPVMKKHVRVPDMPEDDIGRDFNIVPMKLSQRLLRQRQPRCGILELSTQGEVIPERCDEPQNGQTEELDQAGTAQECTELTSKDTDSNSTGTIFTNRVYPASKADGNEEQDLSSTVTETCNSHDGTIRNLEKNARVSTENGSDTSALSGSQGENTQVTSQDDIHTTREMVTHPGMVEGGVEEEHLPEVEEMTITTVFDTRESHTNQQRGISPMLDTQTEGLRHRSPGHPFRVTKPTSTPRQAPRTVTVSQPHNDFQSGAQKQPSEEDLLYLLMHKLRQQSQTRIKDHERHRDIEQQNEELRGVNQILQGELDSTVAARDEWFHKAKSMCHELNLSKEKYKKIKAWALEMNNEYAALLQESSNFRVSLASLTSENTETREFVQSALISNGQATAAVALVRTDLSDTRQSLQVLTGELQATRGTLAEKSTELRYLTDEVQETRRVLTEKSTDLQILTEKLSEARERLAEKRAELRTAKSTKHGIQAVMAELFNVHKAFEHRTERYQSTLTEALSKLANDVDSIAVNSVRSHSLNEILQCVKGLSMPDAATNTGLAEVNSTISDLAEQLNVFQQDVKNSLPKNFDNDKSISVSEHISSIRDTIEEMKPKLQEIRELEILNARLQEKADGDTNVRELIRETKRDAETRQMEVQKNNNKLIDLLSGLTEREREKETKSRIELASDLQSQISETRLKLDRARSDLAEARVTATTLENETGSLRQRLDDCEKQFALEKETLRLQHEADIEALQLMSTVNHAETETKLQAQIQAKAEVVDELKRELHVMQECIDHGEQELGVLREKGEDLTESLQNAQSEARQCMTQLAEKDKICVELEKSLNVRANIDDEKIRSLEEALSSKEAKLQNTTTNLECVERNLENALQKCDTQDAVFKTLEKEAKKAQDHAQKVAEQQKLDMKAVREALAAAEAKVKAITGLEAIISNRDADINRLRSSLEDSQNKCMNLNAVNAEKLDLEDEVKKLRQKQSIATENARLVAIFEESNKVKDDTIVDLKKQVSIISQFEDEASTLRQQVLDQETHIITQSKEIERLKMQTAQQEWRQDQQISDDLEGVFTQNTDISNASQEEHHEIVTGFRSISDPAPTNAVRNHTLQIIDPQVLMTATPLKEIRNMAEVSTKPLSQVTVIPDSQVDLTAKVCDGQHAYSESSKKIPRSSSPLSDVNEDYAEGNLSTDARDSDSEPEIQESYQAKPTSQAGDDMYNIPLASPEPQPRHRISRALARRPSSIVSQDDMLLHASETGRHSSPQPSQSQSARRVAAGSGSGSTADKTQRDRTISRHSNNHLIKPSSSRQTDTIGLGQTSSVMQSTRAVSREPNRPNSAIKRIADEDTTIVNDRFNGKRLKSSDDRRERKVPNVRQHDPLGMTKSTLNANPAGRNRFMPTVDDPDTEPKRPATRLKSIRKQTKQDRYSTKFNNSSQS